MSLRIVPAVFFSTCLTLMAQDTSGIAVLRHAAEAYRSLKSERVEATVVMDMKTYRIETPIVGSIVRPGKIRFEVVNAMMGSQTVSDGRSIWKYAAGFRQYTRKPASSPGDFPLADGPADVLLGERVLDRLQSARLLRREKVTANGRQIDCDVIEAAYLPEASAPNSGQRRIKTFWVDIRRRLILRVSSSIKVDSFETGGTREIAQTITVTSVKLNQPLQDSLFTFVPPAGVTEVAELMPPGGKSQNGHKVEIERE